MKSLSFCVAVGLMLPWGLNIWWQLGLSFMETWRLQAQMTELGRQVWVFEGNGLALI